MNAVVSKDGVISFTSANNSKGLLSHEAITKEAMKLLISSQEKVKAFEVHQRISELRKSCGVKTNLKIKIEGDI